MPRDGLHLAAAEGADRFVDDAVDDARESSTDAPLSLQMRLLEKAGYSRDLERPLLGD